MRHGLISALLLLAFLPATAAHAQPNFAKVFVPDTIGPGNISTATFVIDNSSGAATTGLAFTDTLPIVPGAVTIADPANASTTCSLGATGTLTAPAGGTAITLTDARIGPAETCTVTVDVTASTAGAHTNPAITLSSSAGSSMSSPVDLTVDTAVPVFSKSFAPSAVSLGERSTLTFTIDNTLNASALTSLNLTDNFPNGLEIADPANASTTCVGPTGFTFNAVAGTNVVSLSAFGFGIPGFEVLLPGATCTVIVDVVGVGNGMLDNVTEPLTYAAGSFSRAAGKASDTLDVTVTRLSLQKVFTDDPTPAGNATTLEFTIDNFDRNFSATGVAFTDDLTTLVPGLAGLTFSSLLSNDCGGAVSGVGGTMIGFSGGTLAPEGSCTLRVSLTVPAGAAPGTYTNTTSTITATVDGSPVVGNMASDDLFVEPIPLLTKTFTDDPVNPGDAVVLEFTATNTSTTSSATDLAFVDRFDTIMATASVTPGNDCCGAGSTCAFTPLFDPGPDQSVVPAQLTISGGTLAPAGMAGDSCTFSITLDVGIDTAPGIYPNVTSDITATVDGATRTGDPASDDLTVIAAPRLSKQFLDDPVAPGDTVTLQFTLDYPADASGDATAITFTDDLAPVLAGLTANLPSSPDPPCGPGSTLTGSAGDTLLTLMGGTLSPGESCAFSVTLDVPMGATAGTFTNTTSGVGATVQGLPATSGPASDDLTVAGLTLVKEFIDDPVIPGEMVTLRFTLENISPTDDVTGISFNDDINAVLPGPELMITGGVPATPCGAGSSLFTIGSSFLVLSGGEVLQGDPPCSFDVNLLVPVGIPDGDYTNTTSTVTSIIGGSVFIGPPATDTLVVNSDLLQLSKSFTDDPVAPGGTVTLEFNLANLDAGQAASNIAFTDDLDAALTGLTFDSVLLDTCGGTVGGIGTTMVSVSDVDLGVAGSCTLRLSLTVPLATAADIYTNTTSDVTGTIGGFSVSGSAVSDTLEVIQLLGFSKSFDGPTTASGMATLTFTLTNPGTDTAADLSFSDDLSAVIPGLVANSLPVAPCGADSSISGISFLTFTGGELPPMGGMCSFDVEVLVPTNASAGVFPNVTSDLVQFGLKVSDPATADLTIEPPPSFAKVFSPDVILAGGSSTLTFTIDNTGSSLAANALDFTDNLPAGVAVATPSVTSNTCGGTLTAIAGANSIGFTGGSVGATATCTIDVNVSSLVAGVHVNTTGDLMSSSGNSGTASDTLTVNASADLSVTKSDGVTSATPGGSVTYTIVVTNPGPSADPSVTLSDTFPSPPLTCTYTSVAAGGATGNTAAGAGDLAETLSMPAGSSVTYTASCSIDSDATGTLSNTASITPSIIDTVPGNNSATDNDTELVPEADLAITKSDGVTSAVPGQTTLTYTIVASNSGPSDDPSVSVGDTFPTDLTCSYTSVAAGGATGNTAAGSDDLAETLSMPVGSSVTYTVSCTIDASASGTLSNTATISGSADDPDTGNNSATDDDTVLMPEADLAITKTDGVTSAVPGQTTLTYTIVASNAGVSDDPAASVTDTFPTELACTYTSVAAGGATGNTAAGSDDLAETLSMPVGSSVTYTVSCTIDPAATGTLSNTATITSSVDDPTPGNNSATDNDTVLMPETDLSITKSDSPDPVAIGGDLTYTITVTNNGPSASSGATVTDVLPAGVTYDTSADCTEAAGTVTCAIGAIGVGASEMASFVVTVDQGPATVIDNTASVSANETDPVPGNNSASASTTANPQPGFDKSFAPDSILAGSTSVLTFTIDNTKSTVEASALDFTDNLPADVVVADPANESTTCTGGTLTATPDSGVITYSGGTVDASSTCTVEVEVTSTVTGTHENVTDDLTSSLGNSGSATATLTVTDAGAPEVTAVMTDEGELEACDTVRLPITSIRVTIEDELTPVLNAEDPASYLLVGSGPDADFSTVDCAGGVAGDDVEVIFAGLSLADADPLVVEASLILPDTEGLYRLLVCDTITDTAGNALDGDGDNAPGGDFVLSFFRADPFNLFANGHFDDCPVSLDPWTAVATPPNTIQPGTPATDDVDSSPLSASAHVAHSSDASSTIGQCVPVIAGLTYDFEASLRFDPPMGAVANFSRTCEFFAEAFCAGASLGSTSTFSLIEDEGGAWISSVENVAAPLGASSALCDFGITKVGADPNFDVFLDALYLGTAGVFFEDGFESGDTSAWSSVVP